MARQLHAWKNAWLRRIKRAKGRVLVVGPTGCGKTVVATHLMFRKRVMFIAHTRELIAQAYKRCHEWGIEDVGVMLGGTRADGERHLVEDASARVQIASKQTLDRRKLPDADIVIFDEAHHVPSPGWARIHAHYAKRGAKIYGLTATPVRLDEKGFDQYFDAIVQAPPTSELVRLGHIITPRVWAPVDGRPDLRQIKINERDFHQRQLSATMSKRSIVGKLVEHWKELGHNYPTVVYAVDVEHGASIAKRFLAQGVPAKLLTGDTPVPERAAILSLFETGELKVIVNCQVLTEGWDCPAAKCIVLARPTMSFGLVMQMVGRASRPKNGTRPVVLDLVDNFRHFDGQGLNPIGDIEFPLLPDKQKMTGKGGRQLRTCPECEELVPAGQRVCECGHVFWVKGAPPEVKGELEEWFPQRGLTEAQLDEVVKRYKAGETAPGLAKAFGVHSTSIIRCLRRRGVKIRANSEAHGGLTEAQLDEVVKRYKAGETAPAIAPRFGVSPTTIVAYLRRRGVKMRGYSEARKLRHKGNNP
jgi:DNA repair protein RadD